MKILLVYDLDPAATPQVNPLKTPDELDRLRQNLSQYFVGSSLLTDIPDLLATPCTSVLLVNDEDYERIHEMTV